MKEKASSGRQFNINRDAIIRTPGTWGLAATAQHVGALMQELAAYR